jgi:hypothetical protein
VNSKQPKDTVNLGGTAVYWPAWIWALYALLMACLYRRRRNKEIEREVNRHVQVLTLCAFVIFEVVLAGVQSYSVLVVIQ